MQFLKLLEYPEWQVDLDAEWVEDRAVEIFGQSSAYLSWLFSELQPARVGLCVVLVAEGSIPSS